MRRIQFLLIAAFATTAFTACSDDKDEEPVEVDCSLEANKDHADCVIDCEDPANAEHEDCTVDPVADCLENFVVPSPKTDLCANPADIAAYAPVADTIADTATPIAIGCGALGIDTEDQAKMDKLALCVTCGVADKTGVSPECSTCIADVVACAAAHCAGPCAGSDTAACEDCREENGCDDGVAECQGDMTGGETVDCEDEANLADPACAAELTTCCDEATEYKGDGLCATYCEDTANEAKAACVIP